MPRATFLIIEVEPPEGISSRKLVIETAKHNVITAYSGKEGLALFQRFPAVDAVIAHSELRDVPSGKILAHVKQQRPDVPTVLLSPRPGAARHKYADHVLSSHHPQSLLHLLEKIAA
jgi:hypothetical protein